MGNVSATTFRIDRSENDNESDQYQDDGNSSYYQDAEEGDDNDMEDDDDVEEDEHAVCWHCANCQQMVHAGCERCPTCHGRRGAVRRHDSLRGDGMGDSRYSVATLETRPSSPPKSPRPQKRPSLVTTAPTIETMYADAVKKRFPTPPDSSPPHDLIREPPPPPPLAVPATVSMEVEGRPRNPTAATLDHPSTTYGKLSPPPETTVLEEPQVAKTTMTTTVEKQKVPTTMTAAEIVPVVKPNHSSVVASQETPAGGKAATAPSAEPPVNSTPPTLAGIETEVKGINLPAPNTSSTTVSKTIVATKPQSNLASNHVAAPAKVDTTESSKLLPPSKPATAIVAPALAQHNGNTVRDPILSTKAKPTNDLESNNGAAVPSKEKKTAAVMAAGSRENQPQTTPLTDSTMAKLVKPIFTFNPKPMTPLKSTRETASGTPSSPNPQVSATADVPQANSAPTLSCVAKAVDNSQTVVSSAILATSKPLTTPVKTTVAPLGPERKPDDSANGLSKVNATRSPRSSEIQPPKQSEKRVSPSAEPLPISKTSIYHAVQTTKLLTASNNDIPTTAVSRSSPLVPTETVKPAPATTTTSTAEIQVNKPRATGESPSIAKPVPASNNASPPKHNDCPALTALLSLKELPSETVKPKATSTGEIQVVQTSATGAAPLTTKAPVASAALSRAPTKEPPISIPSSSSAEKNPVASRETNTVERKDSATLQTSDTCNLAMLSNVSANDATSTTTIGSSAVVSGQQANVSTPEEAAATKCSVTTDVISNATSVSDGPKSGNEKGDSATTGPSESEAKPVIETPIDETDGGQSSTKASPKVISESPFIVVIPGNGEILTTRREADQNIAPPNGNVMVEHAPPRIISEAPFIVKISQKGVQRTETTRKSGNKRKADASMTPGEPTKAPRASLAKALQRVAAMDIVANDATSGKKRKAGSLSGTDVVRNPSKRRHTIQNRTDASSSRRGGRRMRYECDWCDCAGFTKDGEMWFLRLADEKDMDEKLLPMVTDAPVKFLCLSCVPRRGTSVVTPDAILEYPEEIEAAEKYNFYLGTKVDYQIWSGEYKKEQFL